MRAALLAASLALAGCSTSTTEPAPAPKATEPAATEPAPEALERKAEEQAAVAKLHGGTLYLDSKPGSGTTAIVTLPRGRTASRPAARIKDGKAA